MFTPNPSIVWKVCAPLTVSAVPEPASTVTLTACEVRLLPAASRAMAVSTCGPVGADSDTENGAAVSSGPALAPSTWNCTPATPVDPAALIVKVRDSAAPSDGEVIDMVIGSGVAVKSTPVTSAPATVG